MPRERKNKAPAAVAQRPSRSRAAAANKTKAAGPSAEQEENAVESQLPSQRMASSNKAKEEGEKQLLLRRREKVSDDSTEDGEVPPDRKKARVEEGDAKVEEDEDVGSVARSSRTIVVEACTQCRSFKERAEKVKTGLESTVPGISVSINPQKPRRGYFEIREEKNEIILSLPSMSRPFKPMKQLNMDKLVNDLIRRYT